MLNRNSVKGAIVVAMDTEQDTLDWLRKGSIAATIAQKPYTTSDDGVKMLDDLHHYPPANLSRAWAEDTFSPVPVFVDTGTTLINKENLDSFVQAQASATRRTIEKDRDLYLDRNRGGFHWRCFNRAPDQ